MISEPPVKPVSIVVPFFGQVSMTLSCVRALERARSFNLTPYEIVLIDDASLEDVSPLLETSARMLRNEENLGYLRSTNRAASEVSGDFVLLLNNDTEPVGNFLDPLVDLMRRRPKAVIAGSQLVYPGGRLQEAGGLIFSDGTGWNFGRGQDPQHAFFAFERPVQYCSAASVLVRLNFWRDAGGFDERFAPAYYEDTDLAMEAWARGFEVWYQPASRVIHREGASHGTDSNLGVKRQQEINRRVFVAKWNDELKWLPAPDATNVLPYRSKGRRGHIVVVDNEMPTPDRDSGSLRITSIMRLFLDLGYSVTFCAHNNHPSGESLAMLQQTGIEVWGDPGTWQDHLAALAPVTALVWLARPHVAHAWLEFVRTLLPGVPVVFDTVDLHSVRQARQRSLLGEESFGEQERVSEEFELSLARRADLTVVVSGVEREFLAERGIANVCVVPNVHSNPESPVVLAGRGLEALFVGGFRHPPNVDAVEWFVSDILPRVRRVLPEFRLRVVGADLADEMRERFTVEGVTVEGYLPRLDEAYRRAGIVVAPLRFGAGVKGKVGEAMAHSVPLVLTTIAAEGFDNFGAGIVADSADEFASGVVTLLTDRAKWLACAEHARSSIVAQMSPATVRQKLEVELMLRLTSPKQQ